MHHFLYILVCMYCKLTFFMRHVICLHQHAWYFQPERYYYHSSLNSTGLHAEKAGVGGGYFL